MGRRPGMPENQRHEAIGRLAAWESSRDVAHHFNVHYTTIRRLVDRVHHTVTVRDRPRSGRPRATTPREDRYLVTSSWRKRFRTAARLARDLQQATGTTIHPQTVHSRLHAAGLRVHWQVIGVPLKQRHVAARLRWARIHRQWQSEPKVSRCSYSWTFTLKEQDDIVFL